LEHLPAADHANWPTAQICINGDNEAQCEVVDLIYVIGWQGDNTALASGLFNIRRPGAAVTISLRSASNAA
jgi:hypothetical protein